MNKIELQLSLHLNKTNFAKIAMKIARNLLNMDKGLHYVYGLMSKKDVAKI